MGAPCGSAGGALRLGGGLAQALVFGGDFPAMPLVVVPGLLAVICGAVLLGIAVLRARVLPRWVGALLIAGALALLVFNEQNERVFLGIPFGAAWVAVGYALWTVRDALEEESAGAAR